MYQRDIFVRVFKSISLMINISIVFCFSIKKSVNRLNGVLLLQTSKTSYVLFRHQIFNKIYIRKYAKKRRFREEV